MTNSEDMWKALSQNNELIKGADTKAAAIVTAAGVLGGVLVRALSLPLPWSHAPLHTTLMLCSIVLVGVCILLALRVFVPRLRMGQSRSLLHFDNIVRWHTTADEFSAACRSLFERDERIHEALAEQLWATSCIARRKFRTVTPTIWVFGAALVMSLAAGATAS